MRVFFYYTATFAFFLLLSLFFKFLLNDAKHQLLVNRIFLVVEFGFLSSFYFRVIINAVKRLIFPAAFTLFLLYSFIDFYLSKPGEFSFIPLVIECFFFIIVIVFFLYEKVRYDVSSPIYYISGFWISVAFLTYFSGNFFLFLFSKSMYKDSNFRAQYALIYSTVTIIKNIFLCTAILANANQNLKEANNNIDIDLDSFHPLQKPTNP